MTALGTLWHYTANTGHVAEIDRDECDQAVIDRLLPIVDAQGGDLSEFGLGIDIMTPLAEQRQRVPGAAFFQIGPAGGSSRSGFHQIRHPCHPGIPRPAPLRDRVTDRERCPWLTDYPNFRHPRIGRRHDRRHRSVPAAALSRNPPLHGDTLLSIVITGRPPQGASR
jgi:hypothetical protein